MSKKVDVPTTAAILRPLRSSTLVRPASLRATMAPSTAVATPVTLSGTPSSKALAARAKLMSMASTFLAASWLSSGPGAPGTIEYSALPAVPPSRSSLSMISVAAHPSCRYARLDLALGLGAEHGGPPTSRRGRAGGGPEERAPSEHRRTYAFTFGRCLSASATFSAGYS